MKRAIKEILMAGARAFVITILIGFSALTVLGTIMLISATDGGDGFIVMEAK